MLNPNFKDILCEFNEAGVDYLIVGAYAMAAHGCPRATGDIDLWVRPTEENAVRVWDALKRFGAPMSRVDVKDFRTPDVVYQIGAAPHRIDVLTSISGVAFNTAWENRLEAEIDGLAVPVIGHAELLANKLATGRPKDLVDAALLRQN